MTKIDPKKELQSLYQPSKAGVVEVDVPTLEYLMIDGQGDPNTSRAYAEAVEALFSVSYAAKFKSKRGPEAVDYAVMPLEGLWWADDVSTFETRAKEAWRWTMMIMQPAFLGRAALEPPSPTSGGGKAFRASPICGSRPSRRGAAPRSSTSAPSPKRAPRFSDCTTTSMRGRPAAESTTKSI